MEDQYNNIQISTNLKIMLFPKNLLIKTCATFISNHFFSVSCLTDQDPYSNLNDTNQSLLVEMI